MIYMVDIDNTICYTNASDYENSKPIQERIDHFNKLYDEGNEIHYWTARGANSHLDWRQFTERQLEEWEVKYTTVRFHKPHYEIWIDDKAINVNEYFKQIKTNTE